MALLVVPRVKVGTGPQMSKNAAVRNALDDARNADTSLARQVEGIMRELDQLHLDGERESRAKSYARLSAGTSTLFVLGGAYTAWLGYKAAHPLWSPIRGVVKNNTLCKLASPIAMTGIFVAAVGLYQMPGQFLEGEEAGRKLAVISRRTMQLSEKREALLEQIRAEGSAAPRAPASR
jgi:hypothetical protein